MEIEAPFSRNASSLFFLSDRNQKEKDENPQFNTHVLLLPISFSTARIREKNHQSNAGKQQVA